MSKTRKLLSVVIALMMVVSMFAMTANAAYYYESEEDAANYTQTWALSEPVDNGDGTYTVDVSLTTNYATGPIQFVLTNTDTSVAAIQSVTIGDAIPEDYNATISVNKTKGKVMFLYDTSSVATIEAVAIDGVIATVVYSYSGSGSATIAIEDDAKSATNVGGSLIAARVTDDNLVTGDPITGQTVDAGNSVVIGGGAAPTLAVIDGTIGVIDTTRTEYGLDYTTCTGYIYGVEPENGETVDAVFEVVGDGEMEIIANEAGSDAGTGTIVNVLDLDGNVVETYVLIIFGDIDCDGAITAFDGSDAILHDAWAYGDNLRIEAPELIFAGDIDVDGDITAFDGSDMILHDAWAYGDNLRLYQSDIISLL